MNRIASLKSLATAVLVLGTLGATTTTAHAQNDVQFSITLGTPGFYAQPAPVYAYPQPVYVQPAPVYAYPRPVYVQPAPMHGWGHQSHYYQSRNEHARGAWGDYDRDGTPNRYDRFPGNPNRR